MRLCGSPLALALLIANMTAALPQQRMPDNGTYSNIGFWTIRHRIVDDLDGCDAVSRFRDQTFFQMALVQTDANHKQWMIFISNSNWNRWINIKRQHTLQFITPKNWTVNFGVNNSNLLWIGNISTEFMDSIANASSIKILNDNNDLLTSLTVKDTASAIKSIVNCVHDHPYKPGPSVAAKSAPPVAAVSGQPPEREEVFTGTAFFVASNRLITNNHVVKDCRRLIEVRFPHQPPRPAYIDAQDATNDLALLHTELTSRVIASFRHRPRVGERIATYGFPYSGLLSPSGNFTQGDVTALSGMSDDSRFVQVSAPIQPGNSGGPLLSMSGSVVGIVTAQLSAFAMLKDHGSVPQNVNFAIGSSIITNFLSVNGVSAKVMGSTQTREVAPADVADLAKDFTVQIYCKGVSSSSSTSNTGNTFNLFHGHDDRKHGLVP